MNLDLLKQLLANIHPHLQSWRWQHGQIGGAVDKATVGLSQLDTAICAEFTITENGTAHTLRGEKSLLTHGNVRVSVDGADVAGADVAKAMHVKFWPPRAYFELDFHLSGGDVWSFTADVALQ